MVHIVQTYIKTLETVKLWASVGQWFSDQTTRCHPKPNCSF